MSLPPTKLFLIGSAIFLVFWGVLIFNLDEKVFGLIQSNNNIQLESSKIPDDIKHDLKLQENGFAGTIKTKDLSQNTNSPIIEDIVQQEKKESIKDKNIDGASILEKEKFYLKGSGQALMKAKNSYTPVEINAVLLPIQGTKFSNFDLVDAKIKVGENFYNFNRGTAAIQKTTFTLNLIPDVENSIFFSIIGSIDFKIKDNIYNGKVIFDDEPFYIYESGNGQFLLSDYTVTISSFP